MKKKYAFVFTGILLAGIISGCSSNKEELVLDKKHKPLPDYVLDTSEMIKETYVMAASKPEVLASVPCYCGCYEGDGHTSNLDCFVDQMGTNNEVTEWDAMGIS